VSSADVEPAAAWAAAAASEMASAEAAKVAILVCGFMLHLCLISALGPLLTLRPHAQFRTGPPIGYVPLQKNFAGRPVTFTAGPANWLEYG
jgi:hypothetical protein